MSTSSLLVTIQQLHSLEIEISDKLIEIAINDKDEDSILFLVKNNKLDMTANTAVINGYLEVLKYLHSIGKIYATDPNTMDLAASNGHLEVLKYLHSIGVDCTVKAMDWAANCHLEVVKYLHSIGADCTTDAMDGAVSNGQLEVVKYLHSIGVNCTPYTMDIAVKNEHLEVVKYLHSIGKECTTWAMDWADKNNHTEILDFLKSIKDTPINTSYDDAITLITEARDNKQSIKVFII